MSADEVTLAYADRDAALERLGAVLAERDQLARLHEEATERTVAVGAEAWARAIQHVEPFLAPDIRRAAHSDNPYRGEGAKTDG